MIDHVQITGLSPHKVDVEQGPEWDVTSGVTVTCESGLTVNIDVLGDELCVIISRGTEIIDKKVYKED